MAAVSVHPPGRDWLSILSRPTLAEFATAFNQTPMLEASVLSEPIHGVHALRAFFDATRAMYETIAFTAEHRAPLRTWLEWQGEYNGRPVSGVTVLNSGSDGIIARVRLFHAPLDQLTAFAADLKRRLDASYQRDTP